MIIDTQFIELKNVFNKWYRNIIKHKDLLQPKNGTFSHFLCCSRIGLIFNLLFFSKNDFFRSFWLKRSNILSMWYLEAIVIIKCIVKNKICKEHFLYILKFCICQFLYLYNILSNRVIRVKRWLVHPPIKVSAA